MLLQTDESTLKLHLAPDGCVWYAAGFGAPRSSGQKIAAFLSSSVLAGGRVRVRLLGIPENATLIMALHMRHRGHEVDTVELAGPNICDNRAELDDPELALHRMRVCTLPAAVGGWHPLTDTEYLTYALIARLDKTNGELDIQARVHLLSMPIYRALSFVPTLSEPQAASLIVEIVDPRWYVDRRAPDRQGKLDLFMGLTPAAQRRVSGSATVLYKPRELRCARVLTTWKTVEADVVDLNDPRNFLYRIYNAAKGGWRGDLRASQAFLRYLRYNWLESLEQRRGKRDRLFAPEWFFKSPAEIEGYLKHTAQ